ncbi:MAG: glutaminase A [Pirellulaceae bacterium]|nr:glutaminase A [Pirellulaceae bacterium]
MTASTNDNELDLLVGRMKAAAAPLREVLREIHARHADNDEGKVADYIPELAKADRRWFGITIATTDGQVFEVGDCRQLFTIQSISKPFVYGLALEDHGLEHVLSKVGVEPTGEAFNAIVLDEASNRPFNPMVNAGAIATADLIKGKDYPDRVSRLLGMVSRYCGREVYIDNSVFMSERLTGHRNRAIGHLMLNFGMVGERIEESLELYFQQCSMLVSSHDLAIMGATLANGGVNPLTGQRAIQQPFVKYLLSIMLSCGMYDYAGEWAYRVGIPSKSGVGGGIVGVIPGQFGIGIFSPPLDAKGNSVRGIRACQELSQRFGLHVLESGFTGPKMRELLSPVRSR